MICMARNNRRTKKTAFQKRPYSRQNVPVFRTGKTQLVFILNGITGDRETEIKTKTKIHFHYQIPEKRSEKMCLMLL